ncbi:MAG: hypothetical protein KF777_24940, partial [Planctomycetaceae bacterium]|nr:hypothetical protein [Planctomycetaceae bacterium]
MGIAERLTHAALTTHGVVINAEGFRYAGSLKRKVDCNAVYKLLDEGLWWPLLQGKRLAIVSGHADALVPKLMDPEFVRATGGEDVTWSIATALACPSVNEAKRTHWPRLRDELFTAEWDLLFCAAGSLAALLCERARQAGRKAIDVGSLEVAILDGRLSEAVQKAVFSSFVTDII